MSDKTATAKSADRELRELLQQFVYDHGGHISRCEDISSDWIKKVVRAAGEWNASDN